jgi:anti-sigma factor RsiW
MRMEKAMRPRRRLYWTTQWAPTLAAAALVILVVIVGAVWARHGAREQALGELLDLHVTTIASANPVDVVSTDRHTVKPWFQGKLPFTFNLPELGNSPFKLQGGKVMYFRHSPGAQLLFEVRKHELSVFVFQDQPAISRAGSEVISARVMAFNVETWGDSELRYVVVSDTAAADVHALGDLLRSAGR